MNLFDYVYYRITRYYKQFHDGESYFIVGIVVLSIFQYLNLFVIFGLLSLKFNIIQNLFIQIKHENNKTYSFIMVTVLLIVNYIIYHYFQNYHQLDLKWKFKPTSNYRLYNIYTLFYVILSITSLIITSKFILVKI